MPASLTFATGSADRVDFGSPSLLDNLPVGTWLAWVYPTNVTESTLRPIVSKGSVVRGMYIGGSGTSNAIAGTIGRATTALEARVSQANMPGFAINTDVFMGYCWDVNGGNTAQKLFCGSRDVVVAEPTSYLVQTAGSGTPTDESASNWFIGNSSALTRGWPGRIYWVGLWPRLLTIHEIREVQKHYMDPTRLPDGPLLLVPLGEYGAGPQVDISGNNGPGAVTGATLSQQLPLNEIFNPEDWEPYVIVSSGGGTITGSGGVTLGGGGAEFHYNVTPNGGGTLDGAATIEMDSVMTGSGGLQVSGGEVVISSVYKGSRRTVGERTRGSHRII